MSNWPHEDVESLNAFYGDPRGANGEASVKWEAANLVLWVPPYPLFYSDGKMTPLNHLRVHKLCHETFTETFTEVATRFTADEITKKRLNICGGTYNYRLERGGSRLSVHSWGCAIDMDPGHNPFPAKWQAGHNMMDPDFAAILQAHGFWWRGRPGDVDPMHFQLCRHH